MDNHDRYNQDLLDILKSVKNKIALKKNLNYNDGENNSDYIFNIDYLKEDDVNSVKNNSEKYYAKKESVKNHSKLNKVKVKYISSNIDTQKNIINENIKKPINNFNIKFKIKNEDSETGNKNLKNPNLYINRELSWLEFNRRVLEESGDDSNPLLERMKFLAIFNSNLDEFFMIRVAGLKQRVSANITEPSPDGLSPHEQLVEIYKKTKTLVENAGLQYKTIVNQLKEHNIFIHDIKSLDECLKYEANKYFEKYIMPVLTPLGIDATHPFPHIVNLGFNILIEINSSDGAKLGLVPIPKNMSRFIEIYKEENERHYVLLEDIIIENIERLFPKQKINKSITFRLTRDADIRIQEDEADDLLAEIEKGLKERRFGKAVRLEINGDVNNNKYLLEFLKDEYDLEDMDIYNMNTPLNLTDLWYLYDNIDNPDLKYKPHIPYLSSIFDIDLFSTLKFKDIVLFLPYDSFEPIIDFLNTAADDPDVLAIKMVLYRTGKIHQ